MGLHHPAVSAGLVLFTVLGGATVETVQIAIWGTLLAIVLSIPLSFLGARNTSPHIVVFHLTRLLLNALARSTNWCLR